MQTVRLWKSVALGALAIIGVEACSRPGANILSIQMSRYGMLYTMWPNSSDLMRFPSWSTGPMEPDTSLQEIADRCGHVTDYQAFLTHISDPVDALQATSTRIYRGDIVSAVEEAVPWWRIKLWQVAFGLGLWSGQLDEPSDYLSSASIEKARRFSENWYRQAVGPIVCDAVRSASITTAASLPTVAPPP